MKFSLEKLILIQDSLGSNFAPTFAYKTLSNEIKNAILSCVSKNPIRPVTLSAKKCQKLSLNKFLRQEMLLCYRKQFYASLDKSV